MLLATAVDDFKQVRFRQAAGPSQHRRRDQGIVVKRKRADRLARRQLDRGQVFAEIDQQCRLDAPDQAGEDAIDRIDLGFAEVIDVGQEQVRHLPENLGIVLGSARFGAVQFRAQSRRNGGHYAS